MTRPSTDIATEYLMTLHVPLQAPQAVAADFEIYAARPGGWATGPAIRGEVVAPTGDWLRAMPNGTRRLDVRLSIKADDGSIIFVSYVGRIVTPEAVAARYLAGETIGPDQHYFVIAPTFETASKTHGWLNDIVAIGKMVSSKEGEDGHVRYDIFAVK